MVLATYLFVLEQTFGLCLIRFTEEDRCGTCDA